MSSSSPSGSNGRPALVYADALSNRGGTGVYLRRLLRGLSGCEQNVLAAVGGVITTPRRALGMKPYSGAVKLIWENLLIPVTGMRHRPGLVHLPAFSGRGIPGVPFVVTLHDLAFCRHPSWFPAFRSIYYRLHFRRVAAKATAVMVDSDFTGQEAAALLNVGRERLRRVYLCTEQFAEDPEIFRESYGLANGHIVFTGTIEPRKNLGALLKAWPEVRREHPGLTLVIAGRWGWGQEELRRDLTRTAGVLHTGCLSERMLKSCVSGASLMVYPSLYEGFGLPPLEAASAGVPSVVTPAAALTEIYSEVSTVASGFDPASISRAVLEALDTARDREKLTNFAALHSIEGMTGKVLEVYGEFSI